MKNRLNPLPNAAGERRLSAAFLHATNGIIYFFSTERNGKVQAAASVIVIICGCYFQLTPVEWVCILLCIGAVLMAEMMNTAIELICNFIEPNYDIHIKYIKDVSAGAVFLITIISIIIGLIIFIPYLLKI